MAPTKQRHGNKIPTIPQRRKTNQPRPNIRKTQKPILQKTRRTNTKTRTRKGSERMKKGFKHTEKTKRKISEAKKGKKQTLEHKRKVSEAHKGKKLSEQHKRKISESNKGRTVSLKTKMKISKGNKGRKHSLKSRRNMSKGQRGRKATLETRKKMSKAHKGRIISLEWRKKIGQANKGKKRSLEDRKKRSGKNHPAWLGGKSFKPYGLAFNKKLKEFIRKRDYYRCQECFKHQSELFTKKRKQKKLSIHHIDYDKQNNNPDNLISLCQPCHSKTGFKRKDWTKHFQKVIIREG